MRSVPTLSKSIEPIFSIFVASNYSCRVLCRQVFMRNVNRVKSLVMHIVEVGRFVNSCFQWESVPRSIIAFAVSTASLG